MSPCLSSSIWFGLFWFVKATKKNSAVCKPVTGTAMVLKRFQGFRKQRMPFSAKLPCASTVPLTAQTQQLCRWHTEHPAIPSCFSRAGNYPPLLTQGSNSRGIPALHPTCFTCKFHAHMKRKPTHRYLCCDNTH